MADFLNLQQPPTKKFRSGTNSNESGIRKKNIQCSFEQKNVHRLDFDFKMLSQYDTPDTNNTQDLFDIGNDFNDTLDNTQQQTSTSTTSIQSTVPSSSSPILNQQSTNIYQQTQPRLTYISQTRAQLSSYQTPSLQRIQTTPTSTIVRPTNVISNGIQQQQQQTIYTQQQQQQIINPSGGLNRPLYQRMPTAIQQPSIPSTLVRQQYNTTGMVNMNQNVPQMSIVKVRKFALNPAVSHIPQFGDAASPAGDLLASPNFGICNTTL
jgi:hypothetical protein